MIERISERMLADLINVFKYSCAQGSHEFDGQLAIAIELQERRRREKIEGVLEERVCEPVLSKRERFMMAALPAIIGIESDAGLDGEVYEAYMFADEMIRQGEL